MNNLIIFLDFHKLNRNLNCLVRYLDSKKSFKLFAYFTSD